MSNEKFIITKEDSNFVVIPNVICQMLSDADALGLYVYLASLPPKWEFYKTVIREHFNWGREKLDKKLAILKSHNLIEPRANRNEKGQFEGWCLHVKNGRDFIAKPLTENQNTENPCSGELSTDLDKNSTQNTENPDTGKPVTGFDAPINTTYQKSYKKSFCATAQKKSKADWRKENAKVHDFADSMNNVAASKAQMDNEARHIEQHEQIKRTQMPESLRNMIKDMKVGMMSH